MRTFAAVVVAAWLLVGSSWADEFPYPATVAKTNATARSGPTYGTYPTERLPRYSQVEVHQAGTNGWVAIRPPAGAFDWIPASAVRRINPQLGEAIGGETPAWIGSNVKKVDKHLSQVKLKPGERVQILGEKQVARADGTQETWLKIAPPAGEFRWVQEKYLSAKPAEELKQEETAERLAREERWRRENAADPPGLLAKIPSSPATGRAPSLASMGNPRTPAAVDVVESATTDDSLQRDEDVQPAQFFARGRGGLLARRRAAAAAAQGEDAGDETGEPGELDMEGLHIENGEPSEEASRDAAANDDANANANANNTDADADRAKAQATSRARARFPFSSPASQDIAREPSANSSRSRISLDPAGLPAARAAAALPAAPRAAASDGAENRRPIDLAEFNALLAQLEVDLTLMVSEDSSKWALKSLRQRAEALVEDGPSATDRGRARLLLDRIAEFEATLPPGPDEPVALPTKLAGAAAAGGSEPVAAKPEFNVNYDAVGYLMPVVSSRPGLPPYQLTDRDGNTLQYVSAAPGVNLNRYVKKQVGLYGQRGYLETLKKQHIVAQRVVDLDRHQR
jgi:hypothetical protein